MGTVQQRAPVPGPAFIRQLARLVHVDLPSTSPPLAERLSHWIDWNRAVTLSRALDGRLADTGPLVSGAIEAECDACARARAALVDRITGFRLPEVPGEGAQSGEAGSGASIDFAVFRQHVLDMQRAMQTATGRLRGRLRDLLPSRSAELARLAEVDAVMEMTLSPREHALLGRVPAWLEAHFLSLQRAAASATAPPHDGWLDTFRRDMQDLLLAELDVRFQPIEGLLAALRSSSP